MNIKTLRRIYPYISENRRNVKWRRITDMELIKSVYEKQKTCNCYSMATRYALIKSDKGRELLKNRIWVERGNLEEPAYKIKLSVNGKDEIYRVDQKDLWGKFFKLFSAYNENPRGSGNFEASECNNLNLALDVAISKMISKHPKEKPWYLRIYAWPNNKKCEYNYPSKAFEWFTGMKAETVGENNLRNNMLENDDKEKALAILKKIRGKTSKDYSYIVMSGRTKLDLEKWHCLPITDSSKHFIGFKNRRSNNFMHLTDAEIVENLKAIVGIDWTKSS